MEAVKRFFGVLLLGVAIWLISPVIPAVAHMLMWATLLIVSAIYLYALDPLPSNTSGFRKLLKGLGVITLLTGVILLVGVLSGGRADDNTVVHLTAPQLCGPRARRHRQTCRQRPQIRRGTAQRGQFAGW